MKHIKLLFSISLLLVFGSKIHSQVIKENVKFLIYSARFNNGNYSFLRNEQFVKDKIDGFYIFGSYLLIEKDKKVYITEGKDTMLYFDYSLEVGDTFYFNGQSIYPNVEAMLVDSIKNIKLDDGKLYKHWYVGYHVWIEGLGEKQSAWEPYDIIGIPENYDYVKSICINDTLVYWEPGFKSFNSHPISPTCNYDTLKILNSVNKVSNFGIKIYPNPAQDFIEISSIQNIQNTDLKIYDVLGKETWQKNNQNFPLVIDTKEYISGIYFIKISNENGQTQTVKFMKL